MENINLIRKIAWEFHYKTGIPYDELFAEATANYLEAQFTYGTPKKQKGRKLGHKACPSHYAWIHMHNRLINFCIQEKRLTYMEIEYMERITHPTHFFELYDSFPHDCQEVVNIVLQSRQEFARLMPKEARGLVVERLREIGWPWSRIWDSIREIKHILNETPENCILN